MNIEDSSKLPMPDNLEAKIWFMDSCVIYEMKVINTVTNHTNRGISEKHSYDLYKFSYLDLRNLNCQDYYHFSDTALPVCSYKLKPIEAVNWNFYAKRPDVDLNGLQQVLSDTIINNISLRRIKFSHSADGYTDEIIYYQDCNTKQNIFHINPSIDELYPNCKIVRSESRGDITSKLTWVFELNMLSENLTTNEKAIFLKWGKNAQSTQLPVISLQESMKNFGPDSSPLNVQTEK
ncbi:MAG: hypothetical protein ABIN36_15035 [Ferruginibacter sp.]